MGRKEELLAAPPEPAGEAAAGANAPTPSGRNSKAGKKRTVAGMKQGRDANAAHEVVVEQLERRKKPRVQQHKETLKLQLEKPRQGRKHEYSQESNNTQLTGKQVQEQHLHTQQVKEQQPSQSRSCKRQDLLVDERAEDAFVTDDDAPACRTPSKPMETTTEPPCALSDAAVGAAHSSADAPKVGIAATIDARAAADPYLLEDADYLRRETRWLNRQRVLLLGSRDKVGEERKAPKHCGTLPVAILMVCVPVETLNEVRLSGNCLLHSRPLLVFGAEFEREPHLRVLKELFMQVFGTPRNHPKSKPFFDHAMSFFVTDSRIWFRHYQIAPLVMGEGGDANDPHRQTFIEIGPRFVLDPVKILEGSFCGKTLWRNGEFVRTRDLMRPRRLREVLDFAKRQGQKEKRRLYLESMMEGEPRNKLAKEVVFGSDVVKQQSH
ncbi:ribosome biogenesis protein brix, putative [Eimeria maxima]|uniref:Ribosome biogenesis protein brix, putative n=1 Tax=Eimeria maxima TaxID=5804 RepID=U6M1J1_EIMMA|nr:ribosome biogenesis protein brix, putative [Eimeria maxima]CDJ58072.1 ribosome biogenesis protein brix, putative [Eimeria maxima]